MKINKLNGAGGLQALKKDTRDYSLAGFFNQVDIKSIPQTDWCVRFPRQILDQGDSDLCSAYATCEVTSDQEGVDFLPEYQFYKTKLIQGDFDGWGADLRSACKAVVTYGSLPVAGYEKYRGLDRQDILNKNTWPISLDNVAKNYKKQTYFSVDGKYDMFDNIRAAMWQHLDEKRSILVGAEWKAEWINAENGIIPDTHFDGGYGHAFKIFGQKIINGIPYLQAQLSNGDKIGDNGIFYFPRSVVNRELAPYGAFMFKDIPQSKVIEYTQVQTKTFSFGDLLRKIFTFFSS